MRAQYLTGSPVPPPTAVDLLHARMRRRELARIHMLDLAGRVGEQLENGGSGYRLLGDLLRACREVWEAGKP